MGHGADAALALPGISLVLIACGLPLVWMVSALARNPGVWRDLSLSGFRLDLLLRTLIYNGAAGVIAVLLGVPVGLWLGRARGWLSRIGWVVVPAALFLPSLSYAYGWNQILYLLERSSANAWLLRMTGHAIRIPAAAEPLDVLRCVWTLGAWLWAIPACTVALALSRMDSTLQQHALLDGALRRITLRLLAGPIIASFCAVVILASQEFAVYEPTGISVVATEIRMVFDTGAFSSIRNPATSTDISAGGLTSPDQRARAAAAVATALPLVLITAAMGIATIAIARNLGAADAPALPETPDALRPTKRLTAVAVLLTVLCVLAPVAGLLLSSRSGLDPIRIWRTFFPALSGTLTLGLFAGLAGLTIAVAGTVLRLRGFLIIAGLAFLVGGQLLAIALIRLWNQPWLDSLYDSPALPVAAYLGRFGWIALAAAGTLWGRRWRELRDMAAIDGAGLARTALSVVLPLAWPVLIAAAVLIGALSLSEVPATVLLAPQHPRLLTNLIQTWVHTLRYDPMIEASLLLIALVVIPALTAIALAGISRRWLGPRR